MLNLKRKGQHLFFKMIVVRSSNITSPRDLNLILLCIRYNRGFLSWLINMHIIVSDWIITVRQASKTLNPIMFSLLSVRFNYRFEIFAQFSLTQLMRALLGIINIKLCTSNIIPNSTHFHYMLVCYWPEIHNNRSWITVTIKWHHWYTIWLNLVWLMWINVNFGQTILAWYRTDWSEK